MIVYFCIERAHSKKKEKKFFWNKATSMKILFDNMYLIPFCSIRNMYISISGRPRPLVLSPFSAFERHPPSTPTRPPHLSNVTTLTF